MRKFLHQLQQKADKLVHRTADSLSPLARIIFVVVLCLIMFLAYISFIFDTIRYRANRIAETEISKQQQTEKESINASAPLSDRINFNEYE
jgi:Flp pilus assembly protein TadB